MIEHPQDSRKLLIVDESPENIRALSGMLEDDFQVVSASTAEQALEFAGAAEKPDLILLDIMGPSRQGFEICRLLKRNQRTAPIPVIFMASRGDEEDEIMGLALGAEDFILKPFHIPLVKARINTHLSLKRKTELLEQLAHMDGLMHIPNRRRFDITLEQEWRRAVRGKGTLALLMIDLDEFKPYNDHYGHGAGDECLRMVAGKLASSVQRSADLVARYGGEEFVVLLPDSNQESAKMVARRMRQAVERLSIPHAVSSVADHVTISLGCACVQPKLGESPTHLIDLADRNLYQAKSRGKNCVYAGASGGFNKLGLDRRSAQNLKLGTNITL